MNGGFQVAMATGCKRALPVVVALAFVWGGPGIARAVDGVTEIDETRAEAGGVTPGDAPGLPVTITQPGAYRLTSNLLVKDGAMPAQDTTAIEVVGAGVTIDLNGFGILGKTTCFLGVCDFPGSGVGVDASTAEDIRVVNGSVRGMGGDGIVLGTSGSAQRLILFSNGGDGIKAGTASTVSNSLVLNNGGSGIVISDDAVRVECNIVASNGGDGVTAAMGTTVEGNVVISNQEDGIEVLGSGLVEDNVSAQNEGVGIKLDDNSGILRNLITGNTGGELLGGALLGGNLCGAALCAP
jgi:hypothetical protein